jgi:hypothetical protein
VRPTMVPRFNGPAKSARTVGFRNLWQLESYKKKQIPAGGAARVGGVGGGRGAGGEGVRGG